MVTSFVQSAGTAASGAGANTIAATFGSATLAGTTILVAVTYGNVTSTVNSITDTDGNSWSNTVVVNADDSFNTQSHRLFVLTGAKRTGSANTITVHLSSSVAFRGIIIAEYWGLVDQTVGNLQTNNAGATDFVTTTTKTPLEWGESIVGFFMNSNNTTAWAAGTGFTSRFSQVGSVPQLLEDVQQLGKPAAKAATATLSSGARTSSILVTLSGQNPNPNGVFSNPQSLVRAARW